ncbi:MAG: polymerase, sigma-24 subunit, subfamily, partial [bacterium]|nr:polymerase, sigma-24 subunit, subfamily [bacterium]
MDTIRFTAKEREFVYGVAMKYMKDEEKAHDVTQDALLLAYRHRASFRGDSRFTTWLYRIAATTALMHLRKDRRVPLMVSTSIDTTAANDDGAPAADEPRDEASTPEDNWASSEAVAIAGERLAELGD